jgi:hypothetical protein
MVSPVVSPVASPARAASARALANPADPADPAVPPLILPPTPHDPASYNPQGPTLAQGRGMQRDMQVAYMQKVAALRDVDTWFAQAPRHDPELPGSKALQDDYLVAHTTIKAQIERGTKILTLTRTAISHLPESVLQHFHGVDLSEFSRLSSLKIPLPLGAPGTLPRLRKVHVAFCPNLTELGVADKQHSVVCVGKLDRFSAPAHCPKYLLGQMLLVQTQACEKLQDIDLTQTDANEVVLYGDHGARSVLAPPKLCTLRAKVRRGFDPQGEIFLHMLDNRIAQWAAKAKAMRVHPKDGEDMLQQVPPAGWVKLMQVALVMRKCAAEIAAQANLAGVPTPCLQQACLQEFFGPVLRKYLGAASWLDGHGVLPAYEIPIELSPDLVHTLRLAAKQLTDQGLEPLLQLEPLFEDFDAENLRALVMPETLAEICTQALVEQAQPVALRDMSTLYESTLLHRTIAGTVFNAYACSGLMPESNPPAFTRLTVTGQNRLRRQIEVELELKPNCRDNDGVYVRVLPSLSNNSGAVVLSLRDVNKNSGAVLYALDWAKESHLRPNWVLQLLPPGTTSVAFADRGIDTAWSSNTYKLP